MRLQVRRAALRSCSRGRGGDRLHERQVIGESDAPAPTEFRGRGRDGGSEEFHVSLVVRFYKAVSQVSLSVTIKEAFQKGSRVRPENV